MIHTTTEHFLQTLIFLKCPACIRVRVRRSCSNDLCREYPPRVCTTFLLRGRRMTDCALHLFILLMISIFCNGQYGSLGHVHRFYHCFWW